VVDSHGNLLTVVVHGAQIQDYHGARLAFERLSQTHWPRLAEIWADAIYKGDKTLKDWVKARFGWRLEVVVRDPNLKGFQADPIRWVVERTFAWLGRQRRLSKDYELRSRSSETWIYIAMTGLMTRRLCLSN
jgi:putative transposase